MNSMYVNFVLHAHLPYVRHREANRLEERWLYEAITESYIPLLWNLEKENQQQKWTISFSPPLMEMLADPLVQRRYLHFLDKTDALIQKEKASVTDPKEKVVIQFYEDRYEKIRETFLKYDQNILEGYKHFFKKGMIECITSSATHTFLPYLQTEQGVRMQIKQGISCFEEHFGVKPKGIWLPECAYTPGVDLILYREGIQYTFVDEHSLNFADPIPTKGVGAPVYSPHGIALFARNQKISNKIWSSSEGYPGDRDYREFYRDLAYERDWDYIQSFVHPDGIRIDTGLKYHRITGDTEWKEIYVPEWANQKTVEHARDFRATLEEQLNQFGGQSFPPHIVTLPFDAELFGHWWFEGPAWFSEVLATPNNQIEAITPSEYLARHYQDLETAHVTFSTWGREGYGDVWLNERNEWMYRHLHWMEKKLVELYSTTDLSNPLIQRTIQQLCRDWMLATSSDWAFILDNQSASQYAANRCNEHIERFVSVLEQLEKGNITEELLMSLESDYPFMLNIDLSPLHSEHDQYIEKLPLASNSLKILMLTWEYPPRIIGGLARHVFELSKALAKLGHEVYVITAKEDQESALYEMLEGVHVYRVNSYQPGVQDFLHWIGSLNLSIVEQALELSKKINFDIIHAHDWLVESSAITLKQHFTIPLLATIHATEHGRNQGIYTDLQTSIQESELRLIREATSILICSEYMKNEIMELDPLSHAKLVVIPNGVDHTYFNPSSCANQGWIESVPDHHHIVFSIGRMVPEKGFQTLIEAAPLVLKKHSNVTFIIAGKGPLEKKYQDEIHSRGLGDHIHLIGFVHDDERNELLRSCDIAVFPSLYEPFGIAALEAMIAKKPVVVSHTGGLTSFVKNGVTGLTVAPGSSKELSKAIIALLTNPALSRKIAENGQKTAIEEYNWDCIGEKTAQYYQVLLHEQHTPLELKK
ncbi:1,4-alpha-glucan branching protein domain-containing protein [Bacillus sp. DJP31]|uniref:1,4-alpha-glucan branching protein domain-containing protein n=1 Tax=Bacillus sp. DJP31 TaxID=3409789 RepID=UPI003BB57734